MRTAQFGLAFAIFVRLILTYRAGAYRPVSPLVAMHHLVASIAGKKLPPLHDPMNVDFIDVAFKRWGISEPLKLALPPGYTNHPFSNIVYMESIVTRPETLMFDGDFPLPNLAIDEHPRSSSITPYHFDNRGANATLLTPIDGLLWPPGYTAWRDIYFDERTIVLPTPTLISAEGPLLKPVAAYGATAENKVELGPFQTTVKLVHLSPIVWKFSGRGTPSLGPSEWQQDYVLEQVDDGMLVSWMPPFPSALDSKYGIAVVQGGRDRTEETTKQLPRWWLAERELRRLIVAGAPIEERRRALEKLEALKPAYSLLGHFRVVAELGSDRFTAVWLARQRAACDVPTWYLLRDAGIGWDDLEKLPCYASTRAKAGPALREYIDENVLLRFRDQDRPELKSIARSLVARSFLGREKRAFNYALTDFAALWLERQ